MITLLILFALHVSQANQGVWVFSTAEEFETFRSQNPDHQFLPEIQVAIAKSPNLSPKFRSKYYVTKRIQLERFTTVDSKSSSRWNHKSIRLNEAHAVSTGHGITVAVIDTGVHLTHSALKNKIWLNAGETGNGRENNGIDDDGNGYVDDYRGYNFLNSNNRPTDSNTHGTHVAGIIAADQLGVAPDAKIMSLKFIGEKGGDELHATQAILYAVNNGAQIINCSWGSYSDELVVLRKAIEYANNKGVWVVTSAGNKGRNTDNAVHPPSTIDVYNVVAVGASTSRDTRASFSNFGATTVELAAPGMNIYSTTNPTKFGKSYGSLNGTSMAAPHVSGAIALLLAAEPHLSMSEVKNRLSESVRKTSAWSKISNFGGLLDASALLKK